MSRRDASDAQRELHAHRERERRLLEAIRGLDEEEQRLQGELAHADGQVAYYDSLARDMKREIRRPGLSSILRSLQR